MVIMSSSSLRKADGTVVSQLPQKGVPICDIPPSGHGQLVPLSTLFPAHVKHPLTSQVAHYIAQSSQLPDVGSFHFPSPQVQSGGSNLPGVHLRQLLAVPAHSSHCRSQFEQDSTPIVSNILAGHVQAG